MIYTKRLLILFFLLLTLSVAFGKEEIITVEATAYTHTGNTTATGVYPYEGCVAVDPVVIPLGSILHIEGYGFAVALDTGGDIVGKRIDVFFNDYGKCIKWGRKKVKVKVLRRRE